jgi:5-methylcytosine-specific restriction endonuclease McrA
MTNFQINFLPDYTDDALLGELRRVAAFISPCEMLTKTAYKKHTPRVASNTICRRFGGWKPALEKAGLVHLYIGQRVSEKMRTQAAKRLSNDDLIAEIVRVNALVGKKWLTSSDFNAHSKTSTTAIRLRFGSFRSGLDAAGIPNHPGKVSAITDEQCFENIADVWTHYRRPPAYREMFAPPSRIQGKTYVTRWGTWRKTLRAFVEWSNGESVSSEPNEVLTQSDAVTTRPHSTTAAPRTEADCREIRPGLRFKVFQRDRFRCVRCGRSPATHLQVVLHADHILAVANGGKTILENLQTLCQDCNLGKGRMIL